ncbi:MAG: hypothetical protein ABGW74_08355 [Campylobacterales bacterium]
MGKLEALQKKIDKIADKVKHLRYMLLALISAVIGLIFGISQNKIIENTMTNALLIIGAGLITAIGIMINNEEKKRDKLIDKLEIVKD